VASRIAPVENDASSESSHRIARAISSGSPPRFIGMPSRSRSMRFGSPPLAWMSVCTNPGRTALTRMPSAASSLASPSVIVSTAPLEAA
jgi:hypothetical protein